MVDNTSETEQMMAEERRRLEKAEGNTVTQTSAHLHNHTHPATARARAAMRELRATSDAAVTAAAWRAEANGEGGEDCRGARKEKPTTRAWGREAVNTQNAELKALHACDGEGEGVGEEAMQEAARDWQRHEF